MHLTKYDRHLIPFLVNLQEEEKKVWVNSKRKILDLMSTELITSAEQLSYSLRVTDTQKIFSDTLKIRRMRNAGYTSIRSEEVKDKVNLMQLIDFYTQGSVSRSRTKNISCPLPKHKDDSPSFSFNENAYYCFGCGAKGSVIDFVMEMEGCDFQQALKILDNF